MAESLIYQLCKDVGNLVVEQGCLLHGVPEEAKKLRNNLMRIEAVLKAAEQREMEADVKVWLRELKDVAYDIENVLDVWRIAKLQMQDRFGTSSEHGNITDKPKGDQVCFKCIPTPCFGFKKRHDIASAIKDINSRLDEIYEGKKKFKFPKSDAISINVVPAREITTAYAQFTVVQSQEEDKDELVKKLVHDDFKSSAADSIPIISIVGMGGIGKTTLARLVFDEGTVKSHFSKLIWVCVSNTFNELNVIKAIARGFHVQLPNECEPQFVLNEIENSISDRKFLIVLDDVWEDSDGKWGAILKCLAKGDAQGSRILMTTRNSDFSRKMRAVFALSVGVLSETNAWLLFSYYAFPEGDSNHRGIVEGIAKELVKKCDGLPLALQVLGRHMFTKTTRSEWQAVLASKIWETSFEEKVFNSLAFSYLELRSEAKRCFAFCSVFPKDAVMRKYELIELWMAQGYLQGSKTHEMEFMGEECFNSLVRRSFLQVTVSYDGDPAVIMHDVIHDYALYISNGEAYILNQSLDMPPELGVGPAKLRHLTFRGDPGKFNRSYIRSNDFDLKALRTIFLSTKSAVILKELGSNKACIRALCIHGRYELEDYDLSDIRKLIHLRYLDLRLVNVFVLPSEICDLRYLQTLNLRCCLKLRELPKEIGRLTSLRHLLFDEMDSLPKGLGKLTSLRTLSCFICSSLDSEECSSLEDLRDLDNVRGKFRLKNLNRVADVSEAFGAMLNNKTHISQLTLEFGDGDESLQSDVLEALKPSEESLEFISIIGHRGRRCPRWIGDLRLLKEVRLRNISTELLPELGMLSFLERLSVDGANEVKFWGITNTQDKIVLFPKLTDVCFKRMSQWEYWEGPTEISRNRVTIMPSLRRLTFFACEALRTLPHFLEYVPLETLIVDSERLPKVELVKLDDYSTRWRIGNILFPQTLEEIKTPHFALKESEAPIKALEVARQPHPNFNRSRLILSGFTVPRWITDLTYHLRIIKLSGIEDECLPPLGSLTYLEDLTVRWAKKVEKVGDEFLGISNSNNNDDEVKFWGITNTQDKIVLFPKLTDLCFENMSQWEYWEGPTEISRNRVTIMPSLRHLIAVGCRALQTLPRFLQDVPLETLIVDSERLPKVELVKLDDYSKRWQMGNILFPQTLEEIQTPHFVLKEAEAPIEALEVAQQPDLKFNRLRIPHVRWSRLCTGSRLCTVPRWIMDLTSYLRIIELYGIEDECLPPLGSLTYLEDLTVWGAEKVEKVGDEFLGISNSNNNDDDHRGGGGGASTAFIAFPRLKILIFQNMLAWREWEDPVVLHENIHELVIMPSLCTLTIGEATQLKSLPQFLEGTPLQNLEISYESSPDNNILVDMPKIRNTTTEDEPAACKMMIKARRSNTTLAQHLRKMELYRSRIEWLADWADYCVKLTELRVTYCGEASIVGLEVLSSLKILKIYNLSIRRMGKETVLPPSLEELHIWTLVNWEEWEDPDPPQHLVSSSNESRELNQHGNNSSAIINYLSDLRILSLGNCPNVKALPSFLRTVRLEELNIFYCDALKSWWVNEAGEDWHNWISAIPTVKFPVRDDQPVYRR